eukprot:4370224-Pyramimonas_sp.AAC.1
MGRIQTIPEATWASGLRKVGRISGRLPFPQEEQKDCVHQIHQHGRAVARGQVPRAPTIGALVHSIS